MPPTLSVLLSTHTTSVSSSTTTAMSSSCERFFGITELVEHLTQYLASKGISKLTRTNRRIHIRYSFLLYRTLRPHSALKIFSSTPEALHALSRNTQHVRKLGLDLYEAVYYYNCVFAFGETHSHSSDRPTARPSWLPLPDTCQVVALPPMNGLVDLSIRAMTSNYRPYSLPSRNNPRATLAQLCWLTSLSPDLSSLSLRRVPITDLCGCRRLGEVIAGLEKLKRLDLWIVCKNVGWCAVWSRLFFSLSPSIQRLSVIISDNTGTFPAQGPSDTVEAQDEDEEGEEAQRKGALINLEEMLVHNILHLHTTTNIQSIFAHCPNIKKLNLSSAAEHEGSGEVGQLIGETCTKIESLIYGYRGKRAHDPLPFRIMETLPPQQMTVLGLKGPFADIDSPWINAAFLRHSATLRQINITGLGVAARFSASAILKECRNLEVLCIHLYYHSGHYITLDDALEFPWSCVRLRELMLSISGCEMPVEPGVQPYYSRPTPITLSEIETRHFAQLESLYRNIGSLTSLQKLHLNMVNQDEQGQVGTTFVDAITSFPAMLCLHNTETGRPGYLQHLAGLRGLEVLKGSVSADTEETRQTMGWEEVRWMDLHWRRLEQAEFFYSDRRVREPFLWLRDRRLEDGRNRLSLGLGSYNEQESP